MLDGGAGGFIAWPDGVTHELRAPAGRLCSSFRAEMVALRETLIYIHNHPAHEEDPVIVCTDSQAALSALRSGPAEQRTQLNRAVKDALTLVAEHERATGAPTMGPVPLRTAWERDGRQPSQGGGISPQEQAPVDTRTVHRAAARAADARTREQRPPAGSGP